MVLNKKVNDLTFSTGKSISFSGLIFPTVYLIPVETDSRFFVLLFISYNFAFKKPGPFVANFLTLSHSISISYKLFSHYWNFFFIISSVFWICDPSLT